MATIGQLSRGGISTGKRGSISVFHSGDAAPPTATTGTDTTPATTESYITRVAIPVNTTLTGLAILNGSAVAGNVTVYLYKTNEDGTTTLIANSASTAQSGTAAYQAIPFSSTVTVEGPGLYFGVVQFSSTSARFRTHALGRFTTLKTTGGTYGTAPTVTSPNSFTADVGPIFSTY